MERIRNNYTKIILGPLPRKEERTKLRNRYLYLQGYIVVLRIKVNVFLISPRGI